MKCPFCMKEFDDGQKLCPFCGQQVPQSQNVPNDDLVRAEDTPEFMPPVPDNAELIREDAPKRGKALRILLPILGILVVLVAALLCFKDAVVGFCLRNFSEPVTYFSYVEGKVFGEAAGDWFEEKAEKKNKFQNFGYIADSKLKIADDVSFLFSDLDEDLEDILYWLDGFGVTVDSDVKDGKISSKITLSAQGTELLKGILVADENGESYFSFPTFSSQYLKLTEEAQEKVDFEAIMPKDDVLEKMVNRYYKIPFENLTDVTGQAGVYTRGDGVEEEVYVLTVRVTEKQLHDILTALVAEAENDEELKKIYNDFTDAFVKLELMSQADVKDWEDLIKEAQETLEDIKDEFEGQGEELFLLTDYINSKHEIVGRRITTQQEESFLFSYYKDEKDIDFVLTAEELEIRAAGEVVEDHASVTGRIVVDGMKAVEWKLNWGEEDLSLRANLTDEMREKWIESLGGEANLGPFSNYMDLGILFEMDTEEDRFHSEFSVLVTDKKKITETVEVQIGEADTVAIPDEDDVYSIEDAESWAETFNINKFMDALEESGFPIRLVS